MNIEINRNNRKNSMQSHENLIVEFNDENIEYEQDDDDLGLGYE